MEPIKLTDEDQALYKDLVQAANEAATASKLYEGRHKLFWKLMKDKYDLKGSYAIDEDIQSIVEERRKIY